MAVLSKQKLMKEYLTIKTTAKQNKIEKPQHPFNCHRTRINTIKLYGKLYGLKVYNGAMWRLKWVIWLKIHNLTCFS